MKRQLELLSEKEYDILVIGGGILGLFVAWDAALRGLSVALIDKGDFGAATSSNSLRIIHGGFRHLQSLDFRNVRRFMREQRIFMKLAPHLLNPMPVLIPLYSSSFFTKKSFAAALKIYDLLGIGLGVSNHSGLEKFNNRVLTRQECIEMIPDIEKNNLSGGIIFTDCQLSNSERFSLTIAASAFEEGANLANYVEAIGLIIEDKRVKGAIVKDNLGGDEFEIRSRSTLNASGPWLNRLLSTIDNDTSVKDFGNSRAFNLSIKRDLTNGCALGLQSPINNRYEANLFSKDSRYLFITPWNGKSLIGTEYLPSDLEPENFKVTREEICSFIDEINTLFPSASLKSEDVEYVCGGYVPTYKGRDGKTKIGIRKYIHDHEKYHGLSGLFSARGLKYTEARIVAQETVDLVIKKIGKIFRPSMTESTPLYGAEFNKLGHDINNQINNDNLIKAQIDYAIKEEMAQKLTDVMFRRMDLNSEEIWTNLEKYSEVVAKEFNWNDSRRKKEEDEVLSRFSIFH